MIPRKFILMLAVAWGLSFQVSILLAQQDGKGLTKATVKESTDAHQELTRLAEPLISSSRVLAKLAEVVGPTVVHIESKKFSPSRKRWVEESGSGVITNLGPSLGIKVVTNRHVIQSARLQDITIRMADERILGAIRVWDDPATDIAIIQVDEEPLSAARLGNSDEVKVGHFVAALGSPFNHRGSLTLGIISAKHRRNLPLRGQSSARLLNQDFLQTDAAINPGNSGGPYPFPGNPPGDLHRGQVYRSTKADPVPRCRATHQLPSFHCDARAWSQTRVLCHKYWSTCRAALFSYQLRKQLPAVDNWATHFR